MKFGRVLIASVIATTLTIAAGSVALAQDYPSPQGYVNDFAGLLSETAKSNLEANLIKLEEETGAEVVVVTVNDLGGTYIEDYAVRLFEAWGIGKKEQDNGVLFITAKTEREVRIEVGYGLEPIITDARSGSILDNQVLPSYRSGDYETGILQGAAAIEAYVRGGSPPNPPESNPVNNLFGDNLAILVMLGYITIFLLGFMASSKSVWLGGVWGIIVGIVLGFIFGSTTAKIILPIVSGGTGTLLDYFLSRNHKTNNGRGTSTSWWNSGGSGSGRGGGSFGGFGGGHSGGGGASRGW